MSKSRNIALNKPIKCYHNWKTYFSIMQKYFRLYCKFKWFWSKVYVSFYCNVNVQMNMVLIILIRFILSRFGVEAIKLIKQVLFVPCNSFVSTIIECRNFEKRKLLHHGKNIMPLVVACGHFRLNDLGQCGRPYPVILVFKENLLQ